MENKTVKIPTWFWVASIIFLLWNLMGIMSFYMHTFITEKALMALPEAERNLYGQYPLWVDFIFGLAVFTGTIGCVGLLMKKKWVKNLFMISLFSVIVQMSHNMFMTDTLDVYGYVSFVMPILVILIAGLLVWFTSYSTKKTWLN